LALISNSTYILTIGRRPGNSADRRPWRPIMAKEALTAS
jgi:hypothetical protein